MLRRRLSVGTKAKAPNAMVRPTPISSRLCHTQPLPQPPVCQRHQAGPVAGRGMHLGCTFTTSASESLTPLLLSASLGPARFKKLTSLSASQLSLPDPATPPRRHPRYPHAKAGGACAYLIIRGVTPLSCHMPVHAEAHQQKGSGAASHHRQSCRPSPPPQSPGPAQY